MQFPFPKSGLHLRPQHDVGKGVTDKHTYYFVIYISVVHLKFDVKFEIVPQYPSDDICGHVISSID